MRYFENRLAFLASMNGIISIPMAHSESEAEWHRQDTYLPCQKRRLTIDSKLSTTSVAGHTYTFLPADTLNVKTDNHRKSRPLSRCHGGDK